MKLKLMYRSDERYVIVVRNGRWIAIKEKELQNG